jgi:hypothetical protein
MQRTLVKDWVPNNQQALIVPGEHAELIALNHHLYRCQNDRTFRPSKYIAFYRRGAIRYLFQSRHGPKALSPEAVLDLIKSTAHAASDQPLLSDEAPSVTKSLTESITLLEFEKAESAEAPKK